MHFLSLLRGKNASHFQHCINDKISPDSTQYSGLCLLCRYTHPGKEEQPPRDASCGGAAFSALCMEEAILVRGGEGLTYIISGETSLM